MVKCVLNEQPKDFYKFLEIINCDYFNIGHHELPREHKNLYIIRHCVGMVKARLHERIFCDWVAPEFTSVLFPFSCPLSSPIQNRGLVIVCCSDVVSECWRLVVTNPCCSASFLPQRHVGCPVSARILMSPPPSVRDAERTHTSRLWIIPGFLSSFLQKSWFITFLFYLLLQLRLSVNMAAL